MEKIINTILGLASITGVAQTQPDFNQFNFKLADSSLMTKLLAPQPTLQEVPNYVHLESLGRDIYSLEMPSSNTTVSLTHMLTPAQVANKVSYSIKYQCKDDLQFTAMMNRGDLGSLTDIKFDKAVQDFKNR